MHKNFFRTTSKSENHMQINDDMQQKLKMHAVSMTPHTLFLRSKIDHISVNSKQNSKRLYPVNQGPRTDVLIKKTEGRKSRDTVFLNYS
jgi:hypothetical protein